MISLLVPGEVPRAEAAAWILLLLTRGSEKSRSVVSLAQSNLALLSQLAAVLGNLGFVIPAAIALDLGVRIGFGRGVLGDAQRRRGAPGWTWIGVLSW